MAIDGRTSQILIHLWPALVIEHYLCNFTMLAYYVHGNFTTEHLSPVNWPMRYMSSMVLYYISYMYYAPLIHTQYSVPVHFLLHAHTSSICQGVHISQAPNSLASLEGS